MLERRIDVALLNYGGAFLGRVVGPTSGQITLRQLQHSHLALPEVQQDLARACVHGKLHNQRALLARYQKRRRDERIARALVALRLRLEQLPQTRDLDTLRGVEGAAGADYFRAFAKLIQVDDIQFTARKRRPPPDPVNILLSFGYTLLANAVCGAIELVGLDPHMGALHALSDSRPSLALDLMEEMRPLIVDTAVLRAINTRALTPKHFVRTDTGDEAPIEELWEDAQRDQDDTPPPTRRLELTRMGARRWFATYERRLQERTFYPPRGVQLTYRQIIIEQARRYARHLRGDDQYVSFTST